jgi:TorA maturation chaperone TorD
MRLTMAALAGILLSSAMPSAAAAGVPLFQVMGSQDAAIERAFRTLLNRAPSSFELRRYRMLMQNGWSEADVRRDLRERSDYRAVRGRRGVNAEDVVRRAYQDILGRDPDPDGLSNYRSKIVEEGWSEWDVRQALRRSDEYAATGGSAVGFRTASADRIIRRAYQDILGREPDAAGLRNYRRAILEEGWDEHDVRQALIRSPERRQQRTSTSSAQATEMVRRAYRGILGREPDAGGMSHYTAKILLERWTEEDVAQALRDSDEYREKHR